MLSPYSRTRVREARNSASVWFFVSAVGTKLRAITIISPLMMTQ